LDGYIRKFSKQSVHTAPSLIMASGIVPYVLNRGGGNNLQDESSYTYKKSKSISLTDKSYWICMWKKYSCPVTLMTTDSAMKIHKMSGDHNHSNLLLENNIHDVEDEKIKVAAIVPSIAPRTILGEISVNLEETMACGTALMRSKQSITKAVHRKALSVKGYLPRPKTFVDLESLPSQLTKTTDQLPFLVLNDTIMPSMTPPWPRDSSSFMGKSGRDVLASCMSWYMDGTFKSASNTLFSQVNKIKIICIYFFTYF
jgi:hypothetical protein